MDTLIIIAAITVGVLLITNLATTAINHFKIR